MRPSVVVRAVALLTLGSGMLNLLSLLFPIAPHRVATAEEIFPLEFNTASRFLTLLTGFALVVSSINILKRKRRAFLLALVLASASIVSHLTKGLNYEEAALSAALLISLVSTRREFTVRSSSPKWGSALVGFGAAVLVVLGYGIVGFWSLDRRDFGMNFHLVDAIRMTFEYLSLQADPVLQAHTRHGAWFLDSLKLVTATGVLYSVSVLFRPAVYRFSTQPRERSRAAEIVTRHGRSALDYFKTWPDKSFFFSPSRESFVAYSVGAGIAVALGDPVGPEKEIEATISEFQRFCEEQDWRAAFHQAQPDFLAAYRRQGFKHLKIGDDAVVDLEHFALEGRERKSICHAVSKLEREGVRTASVEPPLPDDLLVQVQEVSDEWLRFSRHRERRFTLGRFDPDYIRNTPLFLGLDSAGRVLAFVNLIPSYCPGEATIDLMRRRAEVPNGIMDFLLVKVFLDCRERGFRRFNLGMAPMAGFREHDEASREERAVHAFFQRLNILFNIRGLRQYKAKYASTWEPRYLVYRHVLDLPRVALAVGAITERKD